MPAVTPFCIGIAGPSCSGKTSIAQALQRRLPGSVTVFGTDAYYLDLSHLPLEERARINFDHPDILESALLAEHLSELRRGQAIRQPVYDFSTHSRIHSRHAVIEPRDFLIVEGLFTLHWPEVREMFDIRVFISAADNTCLDRRKSRDVRERGRTLDSILSQYAATVRPGNEQFILPSQAHADLVVSGEQPIAASAERIAGFVSERSNKRLNGKVPQSAV